VQCVSSPVLVLVLVLVLLILVLVLVGLVLVVLVFVVLILVVVVLVAVVVNREGGVVMVMEKGVSHRCVTKVTKHIIIIIKERKKTEYKLLLIIKSKSRFR